MENEIKKLIEKYAVKAREEPLNYCQWVEVVGDFRSLLKLEQEKCCGKPVEVKNDTRN